jgi:hypothetical protein
LPSFRRRTSASFKVGYPELVFANLDEAFGRTEADEEIQDLLQGVKDQFSIAFCQERLTLILWLLLLMLKWRLK